MTALFILSLWWAIGFISITVKCCTLMKSFPSNAQCKLMLAIVGLLMGPLMLIVLVLNVFQGAYYEMLGEYDAFEDSDRELKAVLEKYW